MVYGLPLGSLWAGFFYVSLTLPPGYCPGRWQRENIEKSVKKIHDSGMSSVHLQSFSSIPLLLGCVLGSEAQKHLWISHTPSRITVNIKTSPKVNHSWQKEPCGSLLVCFVYIFKTGLHLWMAEMGRAAGAPWSRPKPPWPSPASSRPTGIGWWALACLELVDVERT